ncbi:Kelch repeat-containing protein [Rufibacter roseus]|uniref:Kelch repeat-containing protein n=1 Tax=Rufibacter roseus TaxID=1567108 RepID=A0ABW2DTU6_9BACT|nr:kelch repeat-containing protein [Rufibacter roseus]
MRKPINRISFYVYLFLSTLFLTTACSSDDSDTDNVMGDWIRQSEFAGVTRSGAVGFAIGDKAYVGTGYDGKNRLKDFWQYDPSKSAWIRIAEFPGVARSAAVSFSANGKGYVGTGYNGETYLKDFWEYDPEANTWTQIADFPGSARYGALALSINENGYVGAGYDGNYQKDFWQYNPSTGAWTEKVGLGGAKRFNGFAFSLNGKGYIGGGQNNGLYEDDFLEYDPIADSWTRLKALNSTDREDEAYPTPRGSAVPFTINGKAYLCVGTNGATLSEVWQYDASGDSWTAMNAFEGYAREGAVGFAIGNYGFVTTGAYGSTRFDDLWQFDPTMDNE